MIQAFEYAFKYSSIGMDLVSPDGKFLKVNDSLTEILGYSKNDLTNKDFQSITYPDDLKSDFEFVRQIIASEITTYHLEKRYFHKEGNIIWALLSASLVRDKKDKPLYFILH